MRNVTFELFLYVLVAILFTFVPSYSIFFYPNINIALYIIVAILPICDNQLVDIKNISLSLLYFCSIFLVYTISIFFNNDFPVHGLWLILFFGPSFLLLRDEYKLKVFESYIKISSIIILLGIIEFLFIYNGFIFPLGNSTKADTYVIVQTFFNFVYVDFGLFRFQGLTDEPGFLGTVCAFVIFLLDKTKFRKEFYIFIIGGMLTLSLAFYILFFVYLISRIRNIRSLILLLIGGLLFYGVLKNYKDLPELAFVQERFEKGSDADNRTSDFLDRELLRMSQNHEILVGRGLNSLKELAKHDASNNGNAGVKVLLYQVGIIGVSLIVFVFCFLILEIKGRSKMTYVFLLCFLLSLYQREYVTHPYYIVLCFSPLCIADRYENY